MIIIAIIILILVFFLSIIESILFLMFNRWYYQNGIKIFTYKIKLVNELNHFPTIGQINLALLDLTINFKFKELSDRKIAFRETAFQWKFRNQYSPMMRGNLIYHSSSQEIEVAGLLHWSVIYSFALIIVWSLVIPYSIFIMIIGLFFGGLNGGISFYLQQKRYKELAQRISIIKC